MKITKKILLEATIDTDNPYLGLRNKEEDARDVTYDANNINQAILDGNQVEVNKILKNGVKPDENSFKYALIKKNPDVLNSIMKYVKKNDSMLINAIKTKNPEIVDIILKNGIKPDNSKRTLDYAILTNNNDIVTTIIQNGAKPSPLSIFLAITTDNKDIVKTVVEKGKDIPTKDNLIQARNRKQPNMNIISYLNRYVMENDK